MEKKERERRKFRVGKRRRGRKEGTDGMDAPKIRRWRVSGRGGKISSMGGFVIRESSLKILMSIPDWGERQMNS